MKNWVACLDNGLALTKKNIRKMKTDLSGAANLKKWTNILMQNKLKCSGNEVNA